MLALLAEAWPYAVALGAGALLGLGLGSWKAVPLAACLAFLTSIAAYAALAATARGGQGNYAAFWESLGGDSFSAESAVATVLPVALATAGWGLPAVVGAALGTVLRRYGLARRAAAPRIEG